MLGRTKKLSLSAVGKRDVVPGLDPGLPIGGRDASTPHRLCPNDGRRAAGAPPRQAAPAARRAPRRAGARAPHLPPRPQRWAAAVAALVALQDEYRAWLDRLPENLEGSPTAEKLQAITEIDLDELLTIDPPRGYGRD